MAVTAVAHLNFRGVAREALEFYASVFGGQAVVVTRGDMGAPAGTPGAEEVAWGQVTAPGGFAVMAYDVPGDEGPVVAPEPTTRVENHLTYTREPFFLSMRGESVEEVQALWAGLVRGSTVVVEFGPAAWSPAYGVVVDRFGVTWMLDVAVAWEG